MSRRTARRTSKKNRRPGQEPGARMSLWPLGLLVFLVEVLVVPSAASPFRVPKMALALVGLAVLLLLPAVLGLWSGGLAKLRSRLIWPLLALPVLQLLSVAWAADRATALATAAATTVWCVAVALLALMGREAVGRIALWAGAGAGVSALVAVLQLLHLPFLAVEGERGRLAITGLTGNPADLAMAALLVSPFLLFATEPGTRGSRRLGLALGGFLVAAAVATQTLTGLAAAAFVAVLWFPRQRIGRSALVAAALLVAAIAAGIAVGGVSGRLETVVHEVRQGNWYRLFSARADGWTAALEMVRDEPVLGVGAGCFGNRFYPARLAWLEAHGGHGARGELATHFTWAHCDPLQLVAELGLPGLLWLLAFGLLLLPRLRGDPVAVGGLAVALPFLLLHYPAHLAVGILPLALLLAHVVAGEGVEPAAGAVVWQRPAAVLLLVAIAAIGWWQLGVVRATLWEGSLRRVLQQSANFPQPTRRRAMEAIARSIDQRLAVHPGETGELATDLGNALLAAGDPAGAERAFRLALDHRPEAAAELGLGLAVAAQGRTPEALEHLARAGRVNPALLGAIADPGLRQAARNLAGILHEGS